MKKILITGTNSFVGTNFEKWMSKSDDEYMIDSIDMKNEKWRSYDFSKYDVVFHVAGIAHVSSNAKLEKLYYKVNTELTIEVAKKAKKEGVSQFIFMSSIIVYGNNMGIDVERIITKNTVPNPDNFYGNSKLMAEKGIQELQNKKFNIAIIRPPMVYGHGSKGNYPRISKLAKQTKVFPNINNKRSMIHIENLCEFIKCIIIRNEQGIFFPQNNEYVSTSNLVKEIAKVNDKKVYFIKGFNYPITKLKNKINILNKVFGDLVYDENMSRYAFDYNVNNFSDSIRKTEKGE